MKYTQATFGEIVEKLKKEFGESVDETFLLRFGLVFQDLFENYRWIYGANREWQSQFYNLCIMLLNFYVSRNPLLKEIDKKRERNPYWFFERNMVGMIFYVDRWCGNIINILKHKDYLKDLGVGFIHIMPFFLAPEEENDGGYAIADYYQVIPGLGTMDDFSKVALELKQDNIYIMIDFVLNHTSNQHEWAKKALEGDEYYQQFYYMFPDRTIPSLFEKTMPEIFPETSPGNFTYLPEIQKWVMTIFHSYQWDLNYTNPNVLREMTGIMLYLVNLGVDILRLDAIPYLWKRIGTSCQNEPEVHKITQILKACVSIVAPGVLFLAEAIVQPLDIVKYFGEGHAIGKECDLAYNAPLMVCLWDALATRNVKLLSKTVSKQPELPSCVSWVNYIRCHDDIGLSFEDRDAMEVGYNPFAHRRFLADFYLGNFPGSWAKGLPFMPNPRTGDVRISGTLASLAGLEKALIEDDFEAIQKATERIKLLFKILLSFKGVPLLYYGDEIATLNDYSFREEKKYANDTRWVHRGKFDWKKLQSVQKDPLSPEGQVFSLVKKLISLRHREKTLLPLGFLELVDVGNEHILAYVRTFKEDKMLVLANFSDETQIVDIAFLARLDIGFPLVDIIENKLPYIHDHKIVLGPYQCGWFKECADS